MKFKLDANLPIDLIQIFRSAGQDASSVFQQDRSVEIDETLLDISLLRPSLVTLDLDFADVRNYSPDQNRGIIVLRLQRQDNPHVENTIKRLLPVFDSEPVDGRLLIVDENRVRNRT